MTPSRLLLVALLALPSVLAADLASTPEPTDAEVGAALKAINAQQNEAPVTAGPAIPSVTVPSAAPAVAPSVAAVAPETTEKTTTPATAPAETANPAPSATPEASSVTSIMAAAPAATDVSKETLHTVTEPVSATPPASAEPPVSTPATNTSTASTAPAATAEPASVAFPPINVAPKVSAHAPAPANHTASSAAAVSEPAENSALKLAVATTTESEANAAVPPLTDDADLASLLRIGDAKREQRDWPSATLAYRQVLNATNRATVEQTQAALLGLARSHRGAGNLTKACAVYETFAKDYPGDAQLPVVYLELGRCLRVLGAHRLAISRFYSVINSTLKVSKEGTDLYRQLTRTAQFEIAETYFQSGDYEQAHRFYSRLSLLDLAPADRARAAFKSAYSLNLQGNYEKAVTDLRSCITLYPEGENAPEARYLLSVALRRLGRNQESLAAALELLKIEQARTKADPKNWAHWQRKTGNQLANEFYEQGDAATALVIYQCLHDLGGPAEWRIPALYQIGLCQERLRQTGLARKTYQSILDTLRAPSGDDGKTAGLADVASMAEWRLRHLDWLETTDKRLLVFVPPAHVEAPKPPAPPAPSATP